MNPVLKVKNLSKTFYFPKEWIGVQKILAVKSVSFTLNKGKTLAIIGENGAGKSTLAKLLGGTIAPTSGRIWVEDKKLIFGNYRQRSKLMRMIFQNPDNSFDPRLTVGQLLDLPLKVHKTLNKKQRLDIIHEMLSQVGLLPDHIAYYPVRMAAGQKQRVALARALIVKPKVIVADEAFTSIDISMRAQIINLMLELQKKYNLSYIFITQDIGMMKHISDQMLVLHDGRVIEYNDTEKLFRSPKNDITKKLIASYFGETLPLSPREKTASCCD